MRSSHTKETIGYAETLVRLNATGSTSKHGIHTRARGARDVVDFHVSTISRVSLLMNPQKENQERHWKISQNLSSLTTSNKLKIPKVKNLIRDTSPLVSVI